MKNWYQQSSGQQTSPSSRSKARGDESPDRQVGTYPRLYMVRVWHTFAITSHPHDHFNFFSLPFLLEATTDLLLSLSIGLNFLEFYINGIMQCALFIVWLLSLSTILSIFTHVVVYIHRSFPVVAELLSLGVIALRRIHVVVCVNRPFFFFSYWVIFHYMDLL